jgi:hypothetical protein
MARQKQSSESAAQDDAPDRQEQDAQDIQDLPNRDAMSILSGLPTIPGLPPGLLGGDQTLPPVTGAPAPNDTMPVDSAGPLGSPDTAVQPGGDLNTVAPTNEVSQTNVDSAGTTQTTGATQDVPIVQRTS